MTERELIRKQAEYGEERFPVVRSGKFFLACDCGAFALARATGYRVMRRPRREGCVLTTGFPESRLEKVLGQIAAAGGRIERQDADSFVFSGVDGGEDETLVSEQPRKELRKGKGAERIPAEQTLRETIRSFDLSRSTPMEAMNFIDRLQKQLRAEDGNSGGKEAGGE